MRKKLFVLAEKNMLLKEAKKSVFLCVTMKVKGLISDGKLGAIN